ncbi:UNVERIFIED_CONTAM: cytochrome P450, partial [Salmonella enterica subsp. enterica serovar Weltevreden]
FGMLLWQLAKNPHVYRKLQAEISAAETTTPTYNPSNLSYLEAVVKESLRTSMANPTRFPRIVPPTGWTYTSPSTNKSYHLPAGTQVGLQCWTLHFNPTVFPDPH